MGGEKPVAAVEILAGALRHGNPGSGDICHQGDAVADEVTPFFCRAGLGAPGPVRQLRIEVSQPIRGDDEGRPDLEDDRIGAQRLTFEFCRVRKLEDPPGDAGEHPAAFERLDERGAYAIDLPHGLGDLDIAAFVEVVDGDGETENEEDDTGGGNSGSEGFLDGSMNIVLVIAAVLVIVVIAVIAALRMDRTGREEEEKKVTRGR